MEWKEQDPRPIETVSSDSEDDIRISTNESDRRVGERSHTSRMILVAIDLPIMRGRKALLRAIKDNRVTVLVASTGTGKSTIVPALLYEHSDDVNTRLVITQPRRVAAIRLCERVMTFLRHSDDRKLGKLVGYGIRGDMRFDTSETRIIYQTTGYLQRLLAFYPFSIQRYSHVLLDEVHERSIESDFLCLIIKILLNLPQHFHVRLVVMSATMQASLYRDYFLPVNCGIMPHEIQLDVPPQFQVNTVYLEDIATMIPSGCHRTHEIALSKFAVDSNASSCGARADFSDEVRDLGVQLILKYASDGNVVLCFLPGHGEMSHITEVLEGELLRRGETVVVGIEDIEVHAKFASKTPRHFYEIHSLHGMMPQSQMKHPLSSPPAKARRIILATNVAESSLTVARVNVVIDTGLRKISHFDYEGSFSRLVNTWCSRASIKQRQGRTGRVCEGMSIRLFTREWEARVLRQYELPDASFENFSNVLLFAKQLGENWKRQGILPSAKPSFLLSQLPTPPDSSHMDSAVRGLALAGLTRGEPTELAPLTIMGILATRLQLDSSVCRLIFYGWLMCMTIEGIVLAAACSMERDVFRFPTRCAQGMEEKFARDSRNSLSWRDRFDAGSLSEPIQFRNLMVAWIAARTGVELDPYVHPIPQFDPAAIFSAEFEAYRCMCESIAERFETFLMEDLGVAESSQDIETFRFILCHFSARSGDHEADSVKIGRLCEAAFERVPYLMSSTFVELKLLLAVGLNKRVFHGKASSATVDASCTMSFKIGSVPEAQEIPPMVLLGKERSFFKLATHMLGEVPLAMRFGARGEDFKVTPRLHRMQSSSYMLPDQARIAMQFFERKRVQLRLPVIGDKARRLDESDFIYIFRPKLLNITNWYYLSTSKTKEGTDKRSVLPVRFNYKNPVGWLMQSNDPHHPKDYWAVSASIQGLSSSPDINGFSWLTDSRADSTTILPLDYGGSIAMIFQLISLPFLKGLDAIVTPCTSSGEYILKRVYIEGKWFNVHPDFPITSELLVLASKVRDLIAWGTNVGFDEKGDLGDALQQLAFVRSCVPGAVSSLINHCISYYMSLGNVEVHQHGKELVVRLINPTDPSHIEVDPEKWLIIPDPMRAGELEIVVQSVVDIKLPEISLPPQETVKSGTDGASDLEEAQESPTANTALTVEETIISLNSTVTSPMERTDDSQCNSTGIRKIRLKYVGFSEEEIADMCAPFSPALDYYDDSSNAVDPFADVWSFALAKHQMEYPKRQ